MNRRGSGAFIVIFGFALGLNGWTALQAQGHKPKRRDPPLQNIQVRATKTLNTIDHGLHQGLHAAAKGGSKALEAVDRGVHHALNALKAQSKD